MSDYHKKLRIEQCKCIAKLETELARVNEQLELSVDLIFAYQNIGFVGFCGKPLHEVRAEWLKAMNINETQQGEGKG